VRFEFRSQQPSERDECNGAPQGELLEETVGGVSSIFSLESSSRDLLKKNIAARATRAMAVTGLMLKLRRDGDGIW
jgi:hypothetical protein